MSNNYFNFKQFKVEQDKCAMKVGTDGTLLGAWAQGGKRVLDIGAGTGLISLMIAQRFPEASITAVEVDGEACMQASNNVQQSPFKNRINVVCAKIQDYEPVCSEVPKEMTCGETEVRFNSIICNPPFFIGSLVSPDFKRTVARHASSLTFDELLSSVSRLLADDGVFSTIVPSACFHLLDSSARLHGFFLSKRCRVKTMPMKMPKRELLEYSMIYTGSPSVEDACLEDANHKRSAWYRMLTDEFYIK